MTTEEEYEDIEKLDLGDSTVKELENGLKTVAEKAVTPPTSVTPVTPLNTVERQHYLNLILSRERVVPAQIKCGVHHDIFYYGTTVMGEDMKPLLAVVTSNRQIYVNKGRNENEITRDFRLMYRYDFDIDLLDSHVSIRALKDWIRGKLAPTLPQLFVRLTSLNKRYMYYPRDEAHEFVALDIISTFFLPCYDAKGRTFLEAEKGSGKTRQCRIYSLLSFNPVMSADISKSSFFRSLESTCGTLIIDDFDSIGDEQKTGVLQHYKTGYKAGAKSTRTGEAGFGGKRQQETFRNYGHVVMNNTTGIDEISADRSVFLPMIKYDGDITNKTLDEKNEVWRVARDDLYLSGLTYWKEVRDSFDLVTSDVLKARQLEVSRAVLAVASIVSDDVYSRMESWLAERFEECSNFDPETDWDYLAFKTFADKEKGERRSIKSIGEEIVVNEGISSTDREYQRKVRGVTTYLGKVYNRFPNIFKKKREKFGNVVELVSVENFNNYMRVKGWTW